MRAPKALILLILAGSIFTWPLVAADSSTRLREPFRAAYAGDDAGGKHVLALWTFDGDEPLRDASAGGHKLALQGAELHPEGKFGGALLSKPGWPVADRPHCARAARAPGLSPPDAFTIELWIAAAEQLDAEYPEAFLIDKKYVSHTDYQLILGSADKSGGRIVQACLGFGDHSANWHSRPLKLAPGQWRHLAFTYDGQGTGSFFLDGAPWGGGMVPGSGPVAPGSQPLTIGDRNGSYYHGFPGRIDQVRLCRGVLEFRPVAVERVSDRSSFVRMEPGATQRFRLTNLCREPLTGAKASIALDGTEPVENEIPELASGKSFELAYPIDTRLRPGAYRLSITLRADKPEPIETTQDVALRIVAREPKRMPVVMWGGVAGDLDRARAIGFTHGLGVPAETGRVWEAGKPTDAVDRERWQQARSNLDEALSKGMTLVASLSPGAAMRSHEAYLRVNREGKPVSREDVCGLFPELVALCENVGASVARSFGDHPAFGAALIHTEVRDHASLCFHPHDLAAYRAASGAEIPSQATSTRGVDYTKLPDFPADRVIADDDPILRYYRWYWKDGDGWNGLNSAVVRGLKKAGRADLWTWHDPAVRVASVYGSGGQVDYLSQWTYSYPDPIRIGLATDELLAMAGGGPKGQQVMKMTQIIWYRSQTAPEPKPGAPAPAYLADWERQQPDAPFITIAPMHLREAFWTKIARPIKGIMYHGWQSLVPCQSPGGYRFTHPETQHELARLVRSVVVPLGPTLLSVPGAKSDVAFLESFASEMFARRGTYGWCGSWAGDAYHALLYARLQPEIVFDETIAERGLDGFRVLVLADCDVLTRTVAERIVKFQQAGGLVIGDERTCPAIRPDILLPICTRTGRAREDKAALQKLAADLRAQLDSRYRRPADTTSAEIIPYRRHYKNTDYVFLVNDRREYGSYVGQHGLVMENGLAETTDVLLNRPEGFVYDLVNHRPIDCEKSGKGLRFPIRLGPCDGTLLMVAERPIGTVRLAGPASVARGAQATLTVEVCDKAGVPVEAVVPVELTIRDPDGRACEFSGAYAAIDGRVKVVLDIAPNDLAGMWEAEAVELASGLRAAAAIRVEGPSPWPPGERKVEKAPSAVQPKG